MTAVWYIGGSDVREITADEWTAIGFVGGTDSRWDVNNGWSIPATDFTDTQLDLLARFGDFDVNAPDGPRMPINTTPDQEFATVAYVQRAVQDAVSSGLPDLIDCGTPYDTNGA